jgi:hypothetical protein
MDGGTGGGGVGSWPWLRMGTAIQSRGERSLDLDLDREEGGIARISYSPVFPSFLVFFW